MSRRRYFWCLAAGTVLLANVAIGQTRTVNGRYGVLGEWEFDASVTERNDGAPHVWSGPMHLKHVGFCSADGPEEKVGELRLTLSGTPVGLTATLRFDGIACTFNPDGGEPGEGIMSCPDRPDVPMTLTIE
jgi:hypothetical protein